MSRMVVIALGIQWTHSDGKCDMCGASRVPLFETFSLKGRRHPVMGRDLVVCEPCIGVAWDEVLDQAKLRAASWALEHHAPRRRKRLGEHER